MRRLLRLPSLLFFRRRLLSRPISFSSILSMSLRCPCALLKSKNLIREVVLPTAKFLSSNSFSSRFMGLICAGGWRLGLLSADLICGRKVVLLRDSPDLVRVST